MSTPPAGGFGAHPSSRTGVEHLPHVNRPNKLGPFGIVCIVLVVSVFWGFVLLMAWVEWHHARDSRSAEAKSMVGLIARNAVLAQHVEQPCPPAPAVPADFEAVRGKKYQVTAADWGRPGWRCLQIDSRWPITYQYSYEVDGEFVTVKAVGDLDGDDVRSSFELHGHIDPATHELVFENAIRETNPGE